MQRAELIAWLGKSKTAARRTVSGHLSALPIDTRFSDKWMEALVQYHPNKSYPVTNVVFVICARPPYHTRSLFVEARTGGLIDCSWIKCIANLFGDYDTEKQARTKVLSALRNEAFRSDAMQEVSGARGPSAWLALIARRDFRRSGYRYLSRGIDLEGAQFTCLASTIVQIHTYKY